MFRHDHMTPVLSKDRANCYLFHSFHKFYTTRLKQAKVDDTTIQSLLRWSSIDSVDGYNMPSTEDHARMVDAAYNYSPDAITPMLLKQVQAITIDDHDLLQRWCEECSVVIIDADMDFCCTLQLSILLQP